MKARSKEKLIENIIELSNSVSENVKQDLLDYWKTKQLYMKNGVFCLENDSKTTNDMIFELQEENKQLEKVWNIIKEENKALLTLINWAVECDFGFDNFVDDEYVNWEEFEKESNDMNYIESMIYYAKKYNKMQELKQGSDNNDTSK